MAMLSVNGLDELSMDMDAFSELPDSVMENMLLAEAEVIEKAQKRVGKAYGVHRTGVTLESITHSRMKVTRYGGRAIHVYPGARNSDGNRNAEIAFINEYGKRGQPARPFIRDANEESADEAVAKAETVFNDWMKKCNL